jgi:hypothetical protein
MKARVPLYGLFRRVGNRWERKYVFLAFTRESAIRYFQDELIYSGGELRVVGHVLHTPVSYHDAIGGWFARNTY